MIIFYCITRILTTAYPNSKSRESRPIKNGYAMALEEVNDSWITLFSAVSQMSKGIKMETAPDEKSK